MPDVLSPRVRGIAIAIAGIIAAVVTFLLVGRDDDPATTPATPAVAAPEARPAIPALTTLAVLDPARPTSVFVAFPNVDFQIEVFSPKQGEARRLVERGRITPVG